MEFTPMPKTARLSREAIVTEKIDGTNASVFVSDVPATVFKEDGPLVAEVDGKFIYAGSRTRWITPEDDNYGFAAWVRDNAHELVKLGPGHHFGEWWGRGINRGYGLTERRFSLFNAGRWKQFTHRTTLYVEGMETAPQCCHVVPVLHSGIFETAHVENLVYKLREGGSVAAPGFMDPEGVIVYHTAANLCFKKTIKGDEAGKSYEGHVKKERPAKPPRDPNTGGRRKPFYGAVTYLGPFRRSTDQK